MSKSGHGWLQSSAESSPSAACCYPYSQWHWTAPLVEKYPQSSEVDQTTQDSHPQELAISEWDAGFSQRVDKSAACGIQN